MKIVEQTARIEGRTSEIRAEYDAAGIFQVFVKGRLQDRGTYFIEGQTINFGFDCLVRGDIVQIFYCLTD
ncbi:MAG: hypothetical protein P4N41_24050 [Negativicutes bacterium]|nr:hypothetical protein [Negativicutes bacterium]